MTNSQFNGQFHRLQQIVSLVGRGLDSADDLDCVAGGIRCYDDSLARPAGGHLAIADSRVGQSLHHGLEFRAVDGHYGILALGKRGLRERLKQREKRAIP